MDIPNIVRSVVIGVGVLPLSLSFAGTLNATSRSLDNLASQTTPSEVDESIEEIKAGLAKPCVNYLLSKNDSKLERDAKDAVDEYFGGEVDHRSVCDWVVNG